MKSGNKSRQKKLLILSLILVPILIFVGYQSQRQAAANKLIIKGSNYEQAGKFKEAIKVYKKATKLNPKNAEAHYLLGAVYLKKNKGKLAKQALEKAVSLDDSKAKYHAFLGFTYFNLLKEPRKAVSQMKKAVQLEPENYQYQFALAVFYKKTNPKQAIKELKKTIAQAPNLRRPREILISLYQELGNDKEAKLQEEELTELSGEKKVTSGEVDNSLKPGY
jgi:tetratricopeptide (TPR) repeat protein